MLIFLGLASIGFLLLLSAFWSGSETALTTLSKYRVKKLMVTHKSLARPLDQWLRSPYYILTTILVGNNLTNLVLSALATVVMLEIFKVLPQELVEFITWLLLTFILLVFAEITPKVFCRSNPEKVTLLTLPLLSKIVDITRPLSWPLRKIQQTFPKTNFMPISKLASLGLEEMKGLIAEADHAGVLGKDTSQMLDRALNIGELDVKKIMTPMDKVESVDLNLEENQLLDRLVETGRSRVPVYNGTPNNMTGFIHVKDVLMNWQERKMQDARISTELIRPAYFIPPEKKVYDLMKEFQSGHTHMAFVRDALGNTLGVITLEDILEKIVGDILDEYDLKKKKK